MQSSRRQAFTLVELLVVIGIIALLISILLPALNSARRSAQAVKCLASLKEIGNAFQMYAIDSKGYYPPAQLRVNTDLNVKYNLYGTDFPADGYGAYWFNFLNKYVSKEKIGNEDTSGNTVDNVKTKSVFWGCPSFEAYSGDVTTSGTNRVQPGYGMNGYPTFNTNYPGTSSVANPLGGPPIVTTPNFPPAFEWAWNDGPGTPDYRWTPTTNHNVGFVKQKIWTRKGSERCLVADSRLWLAESKRLTSTVIPEQLTDVNAVDSTPETYIALWRHGKAPGIVSIGGKTKYPMKGKFGFNILYCDGHVATAIDPSEAYRSIRMKFPG